MTEYHLIPDKAAWGDGPWISEPDLVLWVDPTTSLQCMVSRADFGHLCGYVGVPAGHPAYEKDYLAPECRQLDAHQGINFTRLFSLAELHGIEPPPTDSTPLWWIGFDCGHYRDYSPRAEAIRRQFAQEDPRMAEINARMAEQEAQLPFLRKTYCPLPYVQVEVIDLAAQLHAMEKPA